MEHNRMEVWFRNGLFRAFPLMTSLIEDDEKYTIIFGRGKQDTAVIYKSAVNFIEFMYEEPEN